MEIIFRSLIFCLCIYSSFCAFSGELRHKGRTIDSDILYSFSLEELLEVEVISSTKTAENYHTAPSVIYLVTEQQILQRGYQNLFDVLKDAPGWDFDSPSGGWVEQYAYLRGTRGLRQVLLLVDGVVQNNINDAEMGRYASIPLTTVKQIEIISGPAASLYGANALLGVINITSKKPEDIDGAELSVSFSSARDNLGKPLQYDLASQFGKVLKNGIGLYAAAQYIYSDDEGGNHYDPDSLYQVGTEIVRAGSDIIDVVPDQGFDNHKRDLYLSLRLDRGKDVEFGVDYSDLDKGLATFLMPSSYYNNHAGTDYRWHNRRLSSFVQSEVQLNEKLRVKPKIYYRQDQIVDDSGFAYTYERNGFPAGTVRYFQQDAFRIGGDISVDYYPVEQLSILFGVNGEYDETENEQSSFSEDENPIFYRSLFSSYGQVIYQLDPGFKLLIGGRYDKESDSRGQFSPRASVVHTIEGLGTAEAQWINKVLYGQSFRALANYEKDDIYFTEVGSGAEPEVATTYEFQSIYIPNNTLRLDTSIWFTEIEDLKISGTEGFTLFNGEQYNYREQKTAGFSSSLDFQANEAVLVNINYTYTDGKNRGVFYQNDHFGVPELRSFEELLHVAKHKINANFHYQINQTWATNLGLKFIGERSASPIDAKYGDNTGYDLDGDGRNDFNGNGSIPSYTLANLTVSYGNHKEKGWQASLKIENLFDKQFVDPTRSDGSWWVPFYHAQLGRVIRLSTNYVF